ncbi:MAG: tRNA epoxyqueuosine(34) reductase QueG [Cyclobacteriaceae bacterium]|nr:tRNA epoxyqueuosine(34) reductase QueG [Cyclobacteriaceae bacterium]
MKPSEKNKHTNFLKEQAQLLGFDFCGISKAEKLSTEEQNLSDWLSKGYHGKMAWMDNHFDKRLNPAELVPGAKSVVSLMYNYYPGNEGSLNPTHRVARYAYGKDYHNVIKEKLRSLLSILRNEIGDFAGRAFVDSAPIMERQWAARSGLGWLGKNTLLLNKERGSYFFLAELVIDLELDYDLPIRDYCGSCTRCIDACPTEAILEGGILDASRCISYLTIELKEAIPDEFKGKTGNWIFGCDICQEVCPWNRFSKAHDEPEFQLTDGIRKLASGAWRDITEEVFNKVFRYSPLKRTKYQGIMRNITFLSTGVNDQERTD